MFDMRLISKTLKWWFKHGIFQRRTDSLCLSRFAIGIVRRVEDFGCKMSLPAWVGFLTKALDAILTFALLLLALHDLRTFRYFSLV